jgi:enoyl-CoA hydratase/carnithine racemase
MILHAIDPDSAIATIALDSPATRNALTLADWQALGDAAQAVAGPDARAVVLTSAHAGMFCSGSHLREIAALADDAAARAPFRLAMRSAIDALAAVPMPVIAAIDGDCHGAGVALAMAADIRIASPRATFAVPPAKLGITYPQADIHRLISLVGPGQAARLLYTAAPIDTAEAARIGLVELVADNALASARDMAGAITALSPASLTALKRGVADPDLDDAVFDNAFAHADFSEGLAAFRERRAARFAGRGKAGVALR